MPSSVSAYLNSRTHMFLSSLTGVPVSMFLFKVCTFSAFSRFPAPKFASYPRTNAKRRQEHKRNWENRLLCVVLNDSNSLRSSSGVHFRFKGWVSKPQKPLEMVSKICRAVPRTSQSVSQASWTIRGKEIKGDHWGSWHTWVILNDWEVLGFSLNWLMSGLTCAMTTWSWQQY